MSDHIYLTRITVRDFAGVSFFEAKIGQVALIQGRNGAGKTSILDAIKDVFQGGSDPATIRKGCDSAEIYIELSNGYTITKVILPDGLDLKVRNPEGGIIRAPKTWLESLAPSLSFDPVGFLNAEPRKRADWLLSKMPLVFTEEEMGNALGSSFSGSINLEKLNEIRTGHYDKRTTINRRAEEVMGAIQTMRRSLPPEAEEKIDWAGSRDQLAARHAEISGEIEGAALKIDAVSTKEKTGKREEVNQKIAELQAELLWKVAALRTELQEYIAEVDMESAKVLAAATRDLEAERAIVSEALGQAKTNADAAMRVAGQLEAIEKSKEIHKGRLLEALELTTTIERLDELKHRKLKEVPIAGFDMKFDGKKPIITIDGIPLDRLNRQQQLYVAMQAVTQASGKLPLVLCECAELDDAHMRDLAEGMKESGMQLIVARWDNEGPLSVKAA